MNEKIYSEDYFQARPNSRFYKGKDLVYDILFLKSIDITINKKNEKRVRKIIFILMLYGYYDFAFFTLLILSIPLPNFLGKYRNKFLKTLGEVKIPYTDFNILIFKISIII